MFKAIFPVNTNGSLNMLYIKIPWEFPPPMMKENAEGALATATFF